MELKEWPFKSKCDICGVEWTERDLQYRYDNITRGDIGTVSGYSFDHDTGVKEPDYVEYDTGHGTDCLTRHTDQTRCLINLSKKMGIFQG